MINFLNVSAFYVGLMKKNLREKKINPKMLFKFKKNRNRQDSNLQRSWARSAFPD